MKRLILGVLLAAVACPAMAMGEYEWFGYQWGSHDTVFRSEHEIE